MTNNTRTASSEEESTLSSTTPGLYICPGDWVVIVNYKRVRSERASKQVVHTKVNPQSVQSSQLSIFTMSVTARHAIRLAQPRLAPSFISRYTPIRFTYQLQQQQQQQHRSMSSTQIPTTMRGVLVEKVGGPEVLEFKTDLPVPKPGAGEVLVKNELAGLNYIDT
jgi:hypothetical protein